MRLLVCRLLLLGLPSPAAAELLTRQAGGTRLKVHQGGGAAEESGGGGGVEWASVQLTRPQRSRPGEDELRLAKKPPLAGVSANKRTLEIIRWPPVCVCVCVPPVRFRVIILKAYIHVQ